MNDRPGGECEPNLTTPLEYASASTGRTNRLTWPVRFLIIIVLTAVALRAGYGLTRPTDRAYLAALPDQIEYFDIGRSILVGRGVVFEDRRFAESVWAFRMPGYPAFVAACGGNVVVVRLVQALLDGSCVVAVFLIARRYVNDVTALVAAALVAMHPFLFYFSSTVLSETLFAAMLAWGVYAALLGTAKGRVYAVAILLLSVYVRPSAIGLGLLAAVIIYGLTAAPGRRLIHAAIAGVAAVIVLAIVLTPWALRNKLQVERLIWTTTNAGFTAYDSFNPQADGSSNQGVFLGTARLVNSDVLPRDAAGKVVAETDTTRFLNRLKLMGEVRRSDYFNDRAWKYARDNPSRVVSLAFAKLGRFWAPWPLSADFGGKWLYVIVGGAYTVPLFVFSAIGVWRGRMPWRVKLILLLPALYFSAVHCVFVGSLRYRVPCDVPLAVLAAAGVTSFVKPRETVPGEVV